MKKGLHRKPTIEELDENINASLKELETEIPETPEIPEVPATETPELPKVPETGTETPPATPESPKTTEQPKENVEPKKDNYEKRYKDSTAEAQILYSKNKKITEAIEKVGTVIEPTNEEMVLAYPEWEEMTDLERRLAKESLMNKKGFEAIKEATSDFKKLDQWNESVDKFLSDPQTYIKTPELEGREEDFKAFSLKPTRINADFDDLLAAFLYAESIKPKVVKKGQMFETGTGGVNDKPKPPSDKISVEESQRLRISDYKKYLDLLRAGKIEDIKV